MFSTYLSILRYSKYSFFISFSIEKLIKFENHPGSDSLETDLLTLLKFYFKWLL